jgi:NitT/TauT family transport system permease protein
MSGVLEPPVRAEYELAAEPLGGVTLERPLTGWQRVWQHGWLRKGLLLAVLALLWEAAARWQNNDLLLPTFVQTM